jgi:hypothetical protein
MNAVVVLIRSVSRLKDATIVPRELNLHVTNVADVLQKCVLKKRKKA